MVVLNTVQLLFQPIRLAKSGSIVSAGASAATAYGFNKTTGQSPGNM